VGWICRLYDRGKRSVQKSGREIGILALEIPGI
jgi:hypothetical protein